MTQKNENQVFMQNYPQRLIETDTFAFEFLSKLAERESWRKEIYRPIYHVHKWWAKRLGSVFRGILLGSILPDDTNLAEAFYQIHNFSDTYVFDPFLGSGVTIGEAHKLGCVALGRDINPVACESVRVAFGALDRNRLLPAFSQLSVDVGERLRALYRSQDQTGRICDVLYYFWVKCVLCPHCTSSVDLFSTRIIARNAYPDRRPEVQVCCPGCGTIFPALNDNPKVNCPCCATQFDSTVGAAKGANATCSSCLQPFSIAATIRSTGLPPAHRLYGKLLLTPEGEKRYLAATQADTDAYEACFSQLSKALEAGTIRLPESPLKEGFNTQQAINYNYHTWRDFFNHRQLLGLGWLQAAIAQLPDVATRDAFLTLFSGLLEFNNLFASYKGEGTGAVRHMFSHHILKPERMPIEANIWGTPKSSGSFTNLFQGRLLRALDYREAPFEVNTQATGKTYHTSPPFSGTLTPRFPTPNTDWSRGIYVTCGSSDQTGLPDKSVNLIVTDPPFFDNVHYSELADFFYAWQTRYPRGFINDQTTTRHPLEVQDTDVQRFAAKLQAVFAECHRILQDDGLLVFTYHHARTEGWYALIEAIFGAGFVVVNAHPIKAELSVATPKAQAKEPIQLDMIIVCRKQPKTVSDFLPCPHVLEQTIQRAQQKLARLATTGLKFSQNDRRITLISQFIVDFGTSGSAKHLLEALQAQQEQLNDAADSLLGVAPEFTAKQTVIRHDDSHQMAFEFV